MRTLWYIGTGPGRQSPAAGGPPITAETTEPKYTLSVVDQSPVRSGGTAGDALRETIALAQAAESFGFARYWVTEHHNLGNLAGTSPEIMVGQILANTSSIRVGSAGVMLPHYSSLKVAENFRVLEALYPGRIDLGVGRAPGSDQRTNAALSYPRPPNDVRHYPRQVVDLLGYLNDSLEEEHPFAVVRAGPGISTAPQVWLLGSRVDSAAMAADMGLPFSYAHFFGLSVEHGPMIADMYRANFKRSEYLAEPLVNVTRPGNLCRDQGEGRGASAEPQSRQGEVRPGIPHGRAQHRGGPGVRVRPAGAGVHRVAQGELRRWRAVGSPRPHRGPGGGLQDHGRGNSDDVLRLRRQGEVLRTGGAGVRDDLAR